MKDRVRKMYELEQLISANGDIERINKLRIELGFPRQGKKFNFNIDEYINLKSKGYSDRKISKMLNTTTATLYKRKKQNGLTVAKVNELIKQLQRVSS